MINIVCCEECKYYKEYKEYERQLERHFMYADGECRRDIEGCPADIPMDCNDFCSRGERKGEINDSN